MKKLLVVFIVVIFTASIFPMNALATSNDTEEKIIKAWIYEDGHLVEIPVDVYNELISTITYVSEESLENYIAAPRLSSIFNKSTEYYMYLPARQVSAEVQGPGTALAATSVSVNASFSSNISYDAKVAIISGFSANVGFSASSATGSLSGALFNVPDGEKGVVMFNPKVVIASGTLITFDGAYMNEKWVEATAPAILSNGLMDGLYSLKLV